jgi:DNA-binding GntR family transcriptional regulator
MNVESIADLAKRHVQVWIIKGDYQPGQQIKEEEIAARLGISRPPVREAFKMLEAEGLVVRKPRRGVYVTEMTDKDVWEVYTLKAALYEMAISLAMESITETQIDVLDSVVRQMENCVDNEPVNLMQYQKHHQNFHDRLMLISGHDRLKKIADSIHNQVCRFNYKSLQRKDHLESSVCYHRKMIDAIRAADRISACRLMKEHVLDALNVLLSLPELKGKKSNIEDMTAILEDHQRA